MDELPALMAMRKLARDFRTCGTPSGSLVTPHPICLRFCSAMLGLACALSAATARGAGSTAPAPTPNSGDISLTNYAFASELGSGIYEIDGRTIQIYSLPVGFTLRPAIERQQPPGLNLLMPVTVGFFDFRPADLLELQSPGHVDALSLEPGVELDYWMSDVWHLYPYAKFGASFSSSEHLGAWIYGSGVRSDYHFAARAGQGLWRSELIYAGVTYRSAVPSDSFVKLRNGAEVRRDIDGWELGERHVQFAPYGIVDVYLKAPSGPYSGISTQTVQGQIGLMLGVNPMWHVLGIELPRIGIGYQFAGKLSGWRFVIGDPF
ncbi:MAG TPA: hypothetical protein VMG11_11540 [Steroidobacteraceae bacterium]|nr:hypothetical protein [Steroidobacteraceae bacterium]